VRRLATIARREYLERVRSKAFLLSTFLAPVLVVGFTLVPSMLMQRQRGKALRIAVQAPNEESFELCFSRLQAKLLFPTAIKPASAERMPKFREASLRSVPHWSFPGKCRRHFWRRRHDWARE